MEAVTVGLEQLFDDVQRAALRLETREWCNVDEEAEAYHRFLAGDAVEVDWFSPWLDRISTATAAGKQYLRVRVVSDPMPDYPRFLLWLARWNVDAGEDIRYLPRARADELALPAYDFWLLDGERLAILHFDTDDRPLGPVVVTDPATVAQHRRWLATATEAAVPFDQFVTTLNPVRSG